MTEIDGKEALRAKFLQKGSLLISANKKGLNYSDAIQNLKPQAPVIKNENENENEQGIITRFFKGLWSVIKFIFIIFFIIFFFLFILSKH